MHKSRFTFISFEEFLKQQKDKKKDEPIFISFEEFLKQQKDKPESMREFLKKFTMKIKE